MFIALELYSTFPPKVGWLDTFLHLSDEALFHVNEAQKKLEAYK